MGAVLASGATTMRRRDFITLVGGATMWPFAARAQRPTTPVVGFVNAAAQQDYKRQLAAFLKGWLKVAMLRAGTSRLNTVGRKAELTGCRR